MPLHGTIIELGKLKFGFDYFDNDWSRPVRYHHVWEIATCRIQGMRAADFYDALGKSATLTDGHISCYLGSGAYFVGELANGGSTKSVLFETHDVPCPKVRKGIETRWHNGRWEKLLRGGWTAV